MTAALTRQDRDTIAWLLRTARQQGWEQQSKPTKREPHRRYRWWRKGAEVTLRATGLLEIWVGVEPGRIYDTELTTEVATVAEFVRALVGAGLIPGQVSVTQPRDEQPAQDITTLLATIGRLTVELEDEKAAHAKTCDNFEIFVDATSEDSIALASVRALAEQWAKSQPGTQEHDCGMALRGVVDR